MATTITDPSQIRVEQVVAPIIDASSVEDHGQDEVQAAMDVLTDQGYFGESPTAQES